MIIIPILRIRYFFPQSGVTKAVRTDEIDNYGQYKLITYSYVVDNIHYQFKYRYSNTKVKKDFKLIYNKNDPAECIIFSIWSIYLSSKMIFPWLIFIIISSLFFIDINRLDYRREIGDNDDDIEILE